jgi:hypothetical protein
MDVRDRRSLCARLPRQKYSGQRLRFRPDHAHRRGRLRVRRRIRADGIARRQARLPAHPPPFPAVVGLYGCPTVINNVETLSTFPRSFCGGGEWYAGLGTPKNGGTRLFAISGHVNKPGIYELPMGFPLRRLIEEVAGGVLGGKKLKAVIPGGSSCPLLTPMKSTSIWTTIRWPKSARCSAPAARWFDEDTCMVDWPAASCTSTRTNPAAGAFPAAKAPLAAQDARPLPRRRRPRRRYSAGRRAFEEYAGQDVLPAGRRRGACRRSAS